MDKSIEFPFVVLRNSYQSCLIIMKYASQITIDVVEK